MSGRAPLPEFREVVDRLNANPLRVAERYAPGGHVRGGQYWSRSPLREDRTANSFVVNLTGAYAGTFYDFANPSDKGDMLDLIQTALKLDRAGALREARAMLGMDSETPAARKLRLEQAERAQALQAQYAADEVARIADQRRRAHAMWLRAEVRLAGTPVAGYLAGRAIGLHHFKRDLSAIRYAPALKHTHVDGETGEVTETVWPAMVTAVYGPAIDGQQAEFWGVHRTWLQVHPDGRVTKAPVEKPKKIYGSLKGGYIRLWSGAGSRGGKGAPLSRASGTVFVCEGIEDGLSIARLRPDYRVLVGITLGNLREMVLPSRITTVVICADNDPLASQADQIERAAARFRREGRSVDIWHNTWGGKDFNDALILAQGAEVDA